MHAHNYSSGDVEVIRYSDSEEFYVQQKSCLGCERFEDERGGESNFGDCSIIEK